MEILDMICAEYGHEIIKAIDKPDDKNKIESMLTKALGVLQEDGVYALALYTKSKGGDDGAEKIAAKAIHDKACELLKKINLISRECSNFLDAIRRDLADNLDRLLFAKELLERTLVYARYHAKALEKPAQRIAAEEGGE